MHGLLGGYFAVVRRPGTSPRALVPKPDPPKYNKGFISHSVTHLLWWVLLPCVLPRDIREEGRMPNGIGFGFAMCDLKEPHHGKKERRHSMNHYWRLIHLLKMNFPFGVIGA